MPRYLPSTTETEHICVIRSALWRSLPQPESGLSYWLYSAPDSHLFHSLPMPLSATLTNIQPQFRPLVVQQPHSPISFLAPVSKHQTHTPRLQGSPSTCSRLFTFNTWQLRTPRLGPLYCAGAFWFSGFWSSVKYRNYWESSSNPSSTSSTLR